MDVARLTALVCAHNQEALLSRCLRGLSFCDEIVVVADRCTDRTAEVARRHGARVISGIFPQEGQRRAAGLDAARGAWILEIEPDEQVSSALAWEIRATLKRDPQGDWFQAPIQNCFGDVPLSRGWAAPLGVSAAPRLYRRGAKSWTTGRKAAVELAGVRAGALKGAITRTAASDVSGVLQLVGARALEAGEDLADAGSAGSASRAAVRGLAALARSLLVQGAWREGRRGLLLALANGLVPVLAYLNARDLLEARARAAVEAQRPTVVGLRAR